MRNYKAKSGRNCLKPCPSPVTIPEHLYSGMIGMLESWDTAICFKLSATLGPLNPRILDPCLN